MRGEKNRQTGIDRDRQRNRETQRTYFNTSIAPRSISNTYMYLYGLTECAANCCDVAQDVQQLFGQQCQYFRGSTTGVMPDYAVCSFVQNGRICPDESCPTRQTPAQTTETEQTTARPGTSPLPLPVARQKTPSKCCVKRRAERWPKSVRASLSRGHLRLNTERVTQWERGQSKASTKSRKDRQQQDERRSSVALVRPYKTGIVGLERTARLS